MTPAPTTIPAKWTVERYHQAVEAGVLDAWKVELLNGVIVEMSPEGPLHSGKIDAVDRYLRKLLDEDKAWVRVGHPVTLATSEPEPDIAIVKPDPEEYCARHPGIDDILLIIEFADTNLTKDTSGEKYKSYAAEAIQDYWVINLKRQVLQVYREPQDGKYRLQRELKEGAISPLALPDLVVDIAKVLRRNRG